MTDTGLTEYEINLMKQVFDKTPRLQEVVLYGSRAMGTHRRSSDIDFALVGLNDDLEAEAVAMELDELPLPYKFDVRALEQIKHQPLREHIERVGVKLYQRR